MAPPQQLTWRDVRDRRLARHALTAAAPDPSPAGVVAAMHSAHAQVPRAAELSVCLRLPGSTLSTVRAALLVEHSLTKTFGPRGTLHLVPTRDLPMWTGALAAVPATRSPFAADVRLSSDQRAEVVAAVADSLADTELTLEELDRAVVARAGRWAGDLVMPAFRGHWPRWRQCIAEAATAGALVHGDGRGRKATYTHPSGRLPGFTSLRSESALPRFLHGYLSAFGPATPEHLARWLSAPLPWAEQLFATASRAEAIEAVEVEGFPAWVNVGDVEPVQARHSLLLLPYFDALSVGFQPREIMFPGRAADRALTRGQAGNYPVVLSDGVVIGVWHHQRSGGRIEVTVETWTTLSDTRRRRLEEQVDRLGRIFQADARLTMGPVSTGPHA